jgi:flagellar hook-associated protein 3 FlgL
MRITFNNQYQALNDNLTAINERLSTYQQQLASGRRLNAPSDDPGGAATAVNEHAEFGTLDRYSGAVDSTNARLSVVDTTLSDIVSQLTAAKTAAASGRGSSVTATQRQTVADELQGIKEALVSDLNAQHRGAYVFAGAKSTTQPYSITNGTVSAYQGDTGSVSVDVDRAFSLQTTFDAQTITQGSDPQDIFTEIDSLKTAILAGDSTGIDAGLSALDSAFNRATQVQASVGTSLKRLDDQGSRLTAIKQAVQTRLSTIEDADLSQSITGLTAAQTAQKAALGAAATINQTNLMDYLQ